MALLWYSSTARDLVRFPFSSRAFYQLISLTDKEAWEPVIEYLFTTAEASNTNGPSVREAWSFDMQNHGEAAALNEEVLKEETTGLSA